MAAAGSPSTTLADRTARNATSQSVHDFNSETSATEMQTTTQDGASANESMPRPKRIACILCRKRKLKCDGNKPSCGTCSRLNHQCEYSEERKKSGPKRGYVKLLEARLKQVETLLESRDHHESAAPPTTTATESFSSVPSANVPDLGADSAMQGIMAGDSTFTDPSLGAIPDFGMNSSDDFSWELIGLGLEEALPSQEIIDELTQIYFDKIHPSFPMIHRARFLASMALAPHMRPAVCLRYIMWAHACMVTVKYEAYAEHFYTRARKYIEQDEMKGHGESIITIAHSQCWTLLGCYEFKLMYFPRAWMSIGRATRLALMMGLHRQDRVGLDVKQTLPPPRDWTDREERRRTFWMTYCQDRYASMGTGWPMIIDEQDILTNLPASEEAFNKSRPEQTLQLAEILRGDGASSLSSFGGVILLATLFGRNLTHLHRPAEDDNDQDLNGAFWKRHRTLDNILLNTALSLPSQLRLPAGISDPNTIFLNMNIHTATICLHQAAIFKTDKNRLPAQISAESKRRCIVAADQITNIMKMISHMDLSMMNPFLAFCLYVSARVFVQYLKSRREDAAIKSSLHFLLAVMQVLKDKNPLTESFLVQLDVDLEGSGLDITPNYSRWKFGRRPPGESPAQTDTVSCSPLFEIRQTQGLGQPSQDSQAPWTSGQGSEPTRSQAYPNLFVSQDRAQTQAPSHLPVTAATTFDGINVYGPPLQAGRSADTSPGLSHNGEVTSRPQSNHPTPSTTSNQPSSHTSYTSPHNPSTTGSNSIAGGSDQSPNYLFGPNSNVGTWNIGTEGQINVSSTVPDLHADMNFGPTGMTPDAAGTMPLPDSTWQDVSINDNNDWMFGWTGTTPQPQ